MLFRTLVLTSIYTLVCGVLSEPSLAAELPGEVTNSIGMKLKLIPASEFMMGSGESAESLAKAFENYGEPRADEFSHEYPEHRVRITQPFYLGMHEITVGQFGDFVRSAGYKTEAEKDGKGGYGTDSSGNWSQKPEYTWQNPGFAQTDDHPVVNVSWNDAVEFCKWLSKKEGAEYRLPTEAEWEYACRAGTTSRYSFGDDPEGLARVGNVADAAAKAKFSDWSGTISARAGHVFTAPAGEFLANAFGLHDMHGNVWEWCADWYGKDYYANSPVDHPTGPTSGPYRVVRGGGWSNRPRDCRSAIRDRDWPDYRDDSLGFRVALVPAE